jgi:dipeptidyl aminopeptidase/acylaminoacyl peptidase
MQQKENRMSSTELGIEQLILRLRIPVEVAVSPAGDRIAYAEARRELDDEGYVVAIHVLAHTDAAGWTPLARFDGHGPAWAGDGTLAFASRGPEGDGISLWREGSGEPRLLTSAEGARELTWDPADARLAYVCLQPPVRDPSAPVVLREPGFRVDGSGLPPRHRELRVVERATGASRAVVSGPFDVRSPAWHPSGETIAFGRGAVGDLRPSGYVVTLTGDERRVTPEATRCDTICWSADGASIVFAGRLDRARCGLNRLYALAVASGEIRLLAPDLERDVSTTDGFQPGCDPLLAPGGADVLFMVTDDFDVALYRTPLDGGPAERVLGGRFEAVAGAAASATEVVAIVADAHSPGELVVWDPRDGSRETITQLAGDLLADLVEPVEREFVSPDSTVVRGLLLRPPGAVGPTPLLLNVHGGPHAAFLGVIADYELLNWEFVARGWSVLMLNPRGSSGRDDAYYRGVVGGWGGHDVQDFLAAVDVLIAEGLVNADQVGVAGYSYGGLMTNVLVARSDRFKAGVAGSSISNLVSHHSTGSYGLFMGEELDGGPAEQWELYDRLSPIRHVEKIEAPLLFLHGTEDQNVPLGQAEELFALLRRLGKTAELVLYPGLDHGWPAWPLRDRTDSDRRCMEWLTRHVLGEG